MFLDLGCCSEFSFLRVEKFRVHKPAGAGGHH
jgi:hypothetical protein